MKRKKRILMIISIILILGILVFSVYLLLYYKKMKDSKEQTHKFIEEYNELVEKEQASYVIIEINPKAILEVINNKVVNLGCLNEDCENIFNIDVVNKGLNETIEILYQTAKEKGVDVSNGVKVSSVNKEIEKEVSILEYTNYQTINLEEEKEWLSKVRDNKDILNHTAKYYYNNKLLEFYQNDSDYGDVYTCNIVKEEISCYITLKFERELPNDVTLAKQISYNEKHQKLMDTLDKFNIEYKNKIEDVEGIDLFKINNIEKIKINNKWYSVGGSYHEKDSFYKGNNNIVLNSVLESGSYGYSFTTLPLSKLDLISLSYNESDLVILKNYHSETISIPMVHEEN